MLQKPYTAYEWHQRKHATCWGRKSNLEKKLTFLVLFISTVLVVVTFLIIISYLNDARSTCSTPGCILAASQIIKHVDPTVDPCEDFFRFACGRYIDDSYGDTSWASIYLAKEEVKRQVDELLREPALPDDPPVVLLLKNFFTTCTDEDSFEAAGIEPLRNLLEELGGWPVVEGDSWEEKFDWKESMHNHRRLGLNHELFMFLSPEADLVDDGQAHILYINAPGVVVIEEEDRKEYLEFMVDIAMMLGAQRYRADIEMRKTLDFMADLRKVSEIHIKRQQEEEDLLDMMVNNRMTIGDLQDNYPYIEWLPFINGLVEPVAQLDNESYVQLIDDSVLHDVFKLINRTPRRVQANFAAWRAITNVMPFLPKELRNLESCSTSNEDPRFEFCRKRLERTFLKGVLEIMYARRYVNRSSLGEVEALVDNVKNAFVEVLEGTGWMDEESKSRSVDKVDSIEAIIGAPEDAFHDEIFDLFSLGLTSEEVVNLTLLEMAGYINWLGANLEYYALNQTVRERGNQKFYTSISEVNAAYSPHGNIIMIQAGILREVFYANNRPNYLNYGGLGSIVGHEYSHALDDVGSGIDKFGNHSDIWSNATRETFENLTDCIVRETEEYELKTTETRVNGSQTLGENLSDYNGLKVAYLAYKRWTSNNGKEPKLPTLEYTPLQLFWISAVAHYCYEIAPQKLEKKLKTETHAPSFIRAYGSVRNNEYFAEDFGCPVGSRMNPARKCVVY